MVMEVVLIIKILSWLKSKRFRVDLELCFMIFVNVFLSINTLVAELKRPKYYRMYQ